MILVFHKENKITSLKTLGEYTGAEILDIKGQFLTKALVTLGVKFPGQILVWCREELEQWLHVKAIPDLVKHPLNLISFRQSGDVFNCSIDYLEYSTSIKVQSDVRYPTWKMSSTVGAAFGSLFKSFSRNQYQFVDADYFFCALARSYQPHGLLSYHEPNLLLDDAPILKEKTQDDLAVFRFARQLFAVQWSFFLFIALILFERKWKFFPLVNSLFYPKIKVDPDELNPLRPSIEPLNGKEVSLDVLIPTLGREQFVYDLLKDLAVQTIIPKNVIIIEQEREKGIGSQMPFLDVESWPFLIDHIFTTQRGPCNARNIGLDKISSDWVFFSDDDIRLEPRMLEDILSQMISLSVQAATVSCLLEGQVEINRYPHQTRIFGAGCSLVKKEIVDQVRFDMAYEFGYAEDSDFGAQIRNLGYDILYLPNPTILHLKAPSGGFREPRSYFWSDDFPNLKPSPTVMLFWIRHFSPNQFNGNKLMFFLKQLSRKGLGTNYGFWKKLTNEWAASEGYGNRLNDGEVLVSQIKSNKSW